MPTYSIDISDAALQRLQAIVARYNDNMGTNLTVKQWLLQHLKELAISEELRAAIAQLEKQKQQELEAAVKAKKEELEAAL